MEAIGDSSQPFPFTVSNLCMYFIPCGATIIQALFHNVIFKVNQLLGFIALTLKTSLLMDKYTEIQTMNSELRLRQVKETGNLFKCFVLNVLVIVKATHRF